ncbi:MAG: Asp-tRNA(Asn)/Glu-tRNA(Gln) amidotransferase subunit GatA [Candidatus Kerfeldbacteria bacterium]|nr:Asp-tRNA(Asn)/Glu-tRNA(Gln) amidotransferase subunit GatA [Candidatus Kerfeldbacteria bacterium]
MDIGELSLRALRQGVVAKKFSATEVVRYYISNLKKNESSIHAFITATEEGALVQARAVDDKVASGEPVGELAGVPLGIKDIINTKGVLSTGGSKILRNYIPPYRATVVERLLNQDAVVVGKNNCDEFAMGGSTENSGFFPTSNPWDVTKVPGGSSGGSAAAVAAGSCAAALGTDTGGSIRQPASFCGVVGLKPTYGRVSRYGLMAMASSLDQAGPFARTVEDAAYLLQLMAGWDKHDATSRAEPVPDYLTEFKKPIKGLRLGVPQEFFGEGLAPEVKQIVEAAIIKLESLGVKVVPVSLPTMPYALAAYYVITPAEVSANLARYDGMRFGVRQPGQNLYEVYTKSRGQGFGAEVKRRIMLGTYVLSAGYYDAYYRQALRARAAIKADFARVFEQVDVLATPTAPTTAFELGSKANDPLAMYMQDIYVVPVNIAGLPAVSIPCGFSQGLPVGLQLIGRTLGEGDILRLAQVYEQATEWHTMRPGISGQ